ncbi:hypothetical protein C4573_05300 [Candidatus Woesearchaeota archaeon]|nr:MAG: hypothetical protein C4573_05300 [Candidatus Woesearchaeota archaeon]
MAISIAPDFAELYQAAIQMYFPLLSMPSQQGQAFTPIGAIQGNQFMYMGMFGTPLKEKTQLYTVRINTPTETREALEAFALKQGQSLEALLKKPIQFEIIGKNIEEFTGANPWAMMIMEVAEMEQDPEGDKPRRFGGAYSD